MQNCLFFNIKSQYIKYDCLELIHSYSLIYVFIILLAFDTQLLLIQQNLSSKGDDNYT